MTKSELKTGMLVTARNGKVYMVLLNATSNSEDGNFIIAPNGNGWNRLSNYGEDLTNNAYSELDIMKVEKIAGPGFFFTSDRKTTVIWERNQKKTYTYAQLKEILGTEFEVIG